MPATSPRNAPAGPPAPSVDRAATVSVVVPVRNGGPALERCLACLGALDPPPDEVVVVLDGTDAGADRDDPARARAHGARVVALDVRRGPAAARNEGVAACEGDVLLFVDADVAVAPDAVAVVRGHLREHPGVAALFGAYDDEPAEPNFTSQYKNLLNHLVHARGGPASTFWSGCGAVRRETFAALGGFDERHAGPAMEDVELGGRLVAAGHAVHLVPGLRGTHLKRWTPRSLVLTDLFQRALPWSVIILRTGRVPGDLDVSPRHRAQVALVGGALACLAGGLRWPRLALAALPAVAAVLVLDAPLLRGLARLRGASFAVRAAPWRLVAYAVSGLGLALAGAQVAGERLGVVAVPPPRLREDLARGGRAPSGEAGR